MIHNELNKYLDTKHPNCQMFFISWIKIPAASCHVLDPAPVDVLSCEAPPAAVH